MDDRQKIQDRLKKKEQEIQGLEERLRTARTYVTALQDILKLLGGDEDVAAAPNASRAILRAGSSVDQARQTILRNGAPVHISALADAIGQDTREGRISLASSLAAYVRKGEIFTRPAPNTFGLVELGHKTIPEEEDGPPAGFGQIVPKVAPKPPPPVAAPAQKLQQPEEPIDDDIPF
jgi:hypothetical protein